MTTRRPILRLWLWGLLAAGGVAMALVAFFLYTPAVKMPPLTGTLTRGAIDVNGRVRTYRTYAPRGFAPGAPLVVVMHGSYETGERIRIATGYGFDRLADQHGFAVAYPDGYEGQWNGCNVVGDYSANTLNIDDVGFLTGMVDTLIRDIGVDRGHVYATGVSRGGSMALRLALEAPSRFRAVAAVSENEPVADNFKCKPTGSGTSSVMIMNGTLDPLVPFDGGEVSLFGLFIRRGKVLSSRESGQYFANLNAMAGAPETTEGRTADGAQVAHVLWRNHATVEVELIAIHGGGHGMPQPYRRHPRLLGPSTTAPNGPEVIWAFFARQMATGEDARLGGTSR
jgi:polyhydroxybutyrate depolymerase